MVLVGEKKNGECAPFTFHFHFSPADEILSIIQSSVSWWKNWCMCTCRFSLSLFICWWNTFGCHPLSKVVLFGEKKYVHPLLAFQSNQRLSWGEALAQRSTLINEWIKLSFWIELNSQPDSTRQYDACVHDSSTLIAVQRWDNCHQVFVCWSICH